MKIIEFTVNVERATVFVRCWLPVQGIDHPITFTLQEQDLYDAAAARQADSWDNADLISVTQAKVGLTLEVPA